MSKLNLLDFTYDGLQEYVLETLKESRFRAEQIWRWLWQKDARSFEEMTNLSKDLRARLPEIAEVRWPEPVDRQTSTDGTVKFLLRLGDGKLIETVLIPSNQGRYTQCLSHAGGAAPWPAPSATRA